MRTSHRIVKNTSPISIPKVGTLIDMDDGDFEISQVSLQKLGTGDNVVTIEAENNDMKISMRVTSRREFEFE